MTTKHHDHGTKHEHREKELTVFACSHCDHKFNNLEDLQKHQNTHEDPMEKLKDEIIKEVDREFDEHDKKRVVWGSILVTTVLVILTFLSIAQTVQSARILNKINSGDFKAGGSSNPVAPAGGVNDLPDMVGGC